MAGDRPPMVKRQAGPPPNWATLEPPTARTGFSENQSSIAVESGDCQRRRSASRAVAGLNSGGRRIATESSGQRTHALSGDIAWHRGRAIAAVAVESAVVG